MKVPDVPASKLIRQLKDELKSYKELQPPEWTHFVKTGAHKERPPEQQDWWYIRAASILRKTYVNGPVGVSRLRTHYGGRQNRGQPPEHFRKGSGKIVRTILQQLEKAGLIKTVEKRGRKPTEKGIKLMEQIVNKIGGESGRG